MYSNTKSKLIYLCPKWCQRYNNLDLTDQQAHTSYIIGKFKHNGKNMAALLNNTTINNDKISDGTLILCCHGTTSSRKL